MVNYLVSVDSETKELPDAVKNALPFNPQTIVDARVDEGSVFLIKDNDEEIPLGDFTGPAGSNTVPTAEAVAAISYPRADADAKFLSAGLDDAGYDIILLIGQSNVQGDSGGAVTANVDVTDTRIWTFGATGTYASQIVLASDPLAHRGSGSTVVGPGMPFARWYANTIRGSRRVLLVPAAANGTAFGSGTNRWDPTRAEDSTNLYALAIAQAKAAAEAAGSNARFAAALWIQGESDAIAGLAGTTYRTYLEQLIDGLRSRLAAPDLPFVIGSMTPEFMASYSASTKAAIDTVHKDVPNRKKFTSFVQGPSAMGRGDNLHYGPAGQREMGKRFVGGLAAAIANTTPSNLQPVAPPAIPEKTVPGQVTGLAVTAGSTQAVLSWTAPGNGGSIIIDYVIQFRTTVGPGSWVTFADSVTAATTATVTGLVNGTGYDFRVAASNEVGVGTYSGTVSATPAPVAPVSASDDFNRADSTFSLGVTPVGGLTWQTFSSSWGISTNRAYATTAVTAGAYAVVDNGGLDGTIQATLATRDAGTALVWRLTDKDNWYCLLVSGTLYSFYKSVAGTVTAIGASLGAAVTDGSVMKVVVAGDTFTAYRDGVSVASRTDTSLTSGSKWGLRTVTTGGRWDDFSVTP